ncbi:GGDEF domain-containing protein [Shewanella gelidii]|uniref:GGDEF domain-containing protein n=1 Tax=Shewanella gelidii TaxID=1642821 RepID=A0A917NAS1_9GAMM|nr:GGDEF domain-containing protein [Shewanella gelidii]MCL1097795.1 GGDEF domain-containing protein [Shewanella gelidii]GGI78703.1 GGDEF domain-containing protein [Shewanella gelidii]
MLPETVDPKVSLLENEHPQINLVRWMHQCELIKRYYQAQVVFVVQQVSDGFEVIVSSINNTRKFDSGVLFPPETKLFNRLIASPPEGISVELGKTTTDQIPDDFHGTSNLLSRPLFWPDGSIFGCLCVLNASTSDDQPISPFMLEPFQILLQQELTLLCQSHRIESLSMRDRNTGMLNHYGFIMMAPRQLNLGRRFGAHAGILFFELTNQQQPKDVLESQHRMLGSIIQDTIRTADIAAHFNETQFVVLVFIDSEVDLQHILKRVDKQVSRQNERITIDSSYSFFSPDSSAKLAPMIEQARTKLKSYEQGSASSNEVNQPQHAVPAQAIDSVSPIEPPITPEKLE